MCPWVVFEIGARAEVGLSLELLTKRGDGGGGDDCDRHRMNTERVPFVLMPSYSCCSDDDTPGALVESDDLEFVVGRVMYERLLWGASCGCVCPHKI